VTEGEASSIRRLPAGVHGIPRDVVERNQRERLIAAMAEVCAEKGYAATSVADVTRRAAVSTASFYRQFADKQECMLASFEELFGRLLEEVERSCEGEGVPSAKVKAAIGTATDLLAADLPSARLLTVEVIAAGEKGVLLQHAAIERLAALLREARGAESSGSPQSPSSEWATVAAMVALVAKRVVRGEKPVPSELEGCILL
jgi:AcrR family transcriptional regulator